MKKHFYIMLVTLIVFVLTACQATPTETPPIDFFKKDPARWLTLKVPAGWVARLSDKGSTPSIVVTDDWVVYQQAENESRARGIIVLPMTDKGSAEQVLQIAVGRFKSLLKRPVSEVALNEMNGQRYASIEYQGQTVQLDNKLAYYLMTVVSDGKRNVLVFTSIASDQESAMKPIYESVVKGITLH